MLTTRRFVGVAVAVAVLGLSVSLTHGQFTKQKSLNKPREIARKIPGEMLNFRMKDIDGKDVDLKQYIGKVVLIVNVASKCGHTPQYEALEAIYQKYKDQGFVVLGFPCNDFNDQEPGTEEEIKKFCTEKYKVTFPIFSKVKCKDPNEACDLYKMLTDKKKNNLYGGPIQWNFTKFLLDRKGDVRARFSPEVKPDSKRVTAKIEHLLKSGEKDSEKAKEKEKDKDKDKDKDKSTNQ